MTPETDDCAPRAQTAGIAVDNCKLPVFRRRLKEAGYEYEDAGPVTGDTTLLTVKTTDMLALKQLLGKCQVECREMKQ